MATIRKRGDRYQVQIRRIRAPERSASFDTKREALAWARKVESDIDELRIHHCDAYLLKHKTLRDLIQRYMVEVTPQKRGGDSEWLRLRRLSSEPIASIPLERLQAPTFATYRDKRLRAGLAPATINRELNTLSAILNHARREWGYFGLANPLSDVRRPPVPRGRDRRLRDGEEARLFAELGDRSGEQEREDGKRYRRGTRNPFVLPLVQLALETAMRRGELLSLEWENIDLVRRVAHLPMTKNGRARGVPLTPRAAEILAGLLPEDLPEDTSPSGLVFDTSAEAVKLAFQRAVQRAGLEDFRFHDLRHEAISRLAERGDLHVLELAAISGHSDLRMLSRYTHMQAARIAEKLATPPG